MPTKTKTSARKGEKKKTVVKPSQVTNNRLAMDHDHLERILGSMNKAMHEQFLIIRENQIALDKRFAALEQAAKPTDPPTAEKWAPLVVGSFVKKGPHFHSLINDPGAGTPDDAVGVVAEVKGDDDPRWHLYGCDFPGASARVFGFTRPGGANHFTPLSEAEIAEHKRREEESKVTELQANDWCHHSRDQGHELQDMLRNSTGNWSKSYETALDHGKRWVRWCPNWISMGAPLQFFSEAPQGNEIPFTEFKRRLLGTIARLKSGQEAKEAAMPLTFGTRVKHEDFEWRIGRPYPDEEGDYYLVRYVPGRPRAEFMDTYAQRSSFTVVIP